MPRAPRAQLEAAELVPRLAGATQVARTLALLLVLFMLASALAPWQQSVRGAGRVIAFAATERRQAVQTQVAGRVVRWLVQEGARVREGDPLVELADNDPQLLERLGTERSANSQKLSSYRDRLSMLKLQIEAAHASRRSEIASAEAKRRASRDKLSSAEQKRTAAEAALQTAQLNLERMRAMTERGLAPRRELELAELAATKGRTELDAARAEVSAAEADVSAATAALDMARAEGDAKIQEAEAKLRSGESDAADAEASLARLEVGIARQSGQVVRAPRDGVVLSVLVAQGGQQVKQGDTLALIVPETADRAVELWVDGNDAAIVSEGRSVRLQFEGWPAVQFTGWPSVAVGTFGGRVAFVDAHDDGRGNFRVVVVPDARDEPWPQPRFLRQGVRAKGWILLERVRLGFELWRRFNGFPPLLDAPPASSGETAPSSSKGGYP
jgi:adhesin transport system membrane fusion protein